MFRIPDLLRRTWTAAITHRPHTARCSPPPPSHRLRLGVEGLEGRDCPSTWTDATGDHQFNNPANWDDGQGAAVTGMAHFTSAVNGGSTDDCVGMSGSFTTIGISADYDPGTITFSGPVTAYMFGMSGGRIDQPGPGSGTDLTVTGWFNWTGGTINGTANLASVILSGATGSISGGGTLNIGSNLTVTNAANLTLAPVTVNFTNALSTILIDTNSTVAATNLQLNTNVRITGVSQINMNSNSYLEVGGPGTLDCGSAVGASPVPLYNNGGRVWLHDGATAKFGGSVKFGGNTYTNSYWQAGSGANTDIQSGSNLVVENPASITDGLLKTSWNPNLADNVTAQTGTLTGDLHVTGGTVNVCVGGAPPWHYGTFYVNGTVVMNGGTYAPAINSTTSGLNDHWESENNFLIDQLPNNGGTATLTPVSSDGANTVANGLWQIIKSRSGTLTGSFATTNMVYFDGPPAKSYTWGTFGNPVNEGDLRS